MDTEKYGEELPGEFSNVVLKKNRKHKVHGRGDKSCISKKSAREAFLICLICLICTN